jgi:hypothetical protein
MSSTAVLDRPRRVGRSRTSRSQGLLYPLDYAYAHAGLSIPDAVRLRPDDIPLPFRTLLVHDRNMTLTLEAHWGPVLLRVLSMATEGESYFRRVVLAQEYSARPVVMGAIRIDLTAFSATIRKRILENRLPFGRLLREGGVEYVSRPKAYFSVTPNSEMLGVFWMREPHPLYGRRTEVLIGRRQVGDIVEVLPPA